MSAAEEIEEGEITSGSEDGEIADSPAKEKLFSRRPETSLAPHYSIFDNQPQKPPQATAFPRPLHSDSESESDHSKSDDDDRDNSFKKKPKLQSIDQFGKQQSFVNPNFVTSGGVMPPLPKSRKNIWSSVLEEQILTASVGSFNMQKKLDNDRDVESYDFTRAKEDDRPYLEPVEEEMKNGPEDDIFGEVVDLEKAAFHQRRNMKRKRVFERVGKRKSVKGRLDLPKVSDKSSVEEVTHYISTMLEESKVHLIRRVVTVLGQAKAMEVYKKTEEVEAEGGMMVMNGQRRRTKGGVFLILLKTKCEVPKEQLDTIFEEEDNLLLERKRMKRKMAKARKRSQQQRNQQQSTEKEKKDASQSTMEVVGEEESNSRSSVEGQRGSPRHSGDHLSDSGDKEHLEEEVTDSSNEGLEEDFETQLAREMKRQSETKEKMPDEIGVEMAGARDGVTLDDVLDIAVEDDFLD